MGLFNFTTLFLVYALIFGLLICYLIFFYQKWTFIKFSWKINGFFIPVLPVVGTYYASLFTGLKGTKVLPKGTSCMISIYHIHRDPENWPNPLKFDSTRFLPENLAKIKPYSFLGFSGGARDCIGKTQAMILMKTTIANVVRNFTITTKHQSIEELCLESCITMKTSNPNLDTKNNLYVQARGYFKKDKYILVSCNYVLENIKQFCLTV